MTDIELDASGWVTADDFSAALFAGLGAPSWHGTSINALVDSMIYGGINDIVPPFRVTARGMGGAKGEARTALLETFEALGDAGAHYAISADGTPTLVIDAAFD